MKTLAFTAVAALTLGGAAARADDLITYYVTGSFADGGKISGTLSLDSTTGQFTAGDLLNSGFPDAAYDGAYINQPSLEPGITVQNAAFDQADNFAESIDDFTNYSRQTIPSDLATDAGYGIDTVSTSNILISQTPPVVSPAPEPSTWLLMFGGIGGIGLMLRRAKQSMGCRSKDAFSA